VTIPAPAGATEVLRLDNEVDESWAPVSGVTFSSSDATFKTFTTGAFVAVKSVSSAEHGTGGSSGEHSEDPSSGGSNTNDGTGGDTTANTGGSESTGGSNSTDGTGGGGLGEECTEEFDVEQECNACMGSKCCNAIAACHANKYCDSYFMCRRTGKTHETCTADTGQMPAIVDIADCAFAADSCGASCL
jgi:hypothetical protein